MGRSLCAPGGPEAPPLRFSRRRGGIGVNCRFTYIAQYLDGGGVMDDVYKELRPLSERYGKLLNLFREFHRIGAPLLTGGDIPGITVGKLVGDRYFDVSLAGTTARFVFTFQASEGAGSKGRVTCYRLDPLKPEALVRVGHFEFNGQGDTGKKMPSGDTRGDPMLVGTDSHACYLIADLLHLAIVSAPSIAKES